MIAEYGDEHYTWEGYVDRAETALDELTRTIDVIVRVPDPFAAGSPVSSAADGQAADRAGPPLLVGKFVEVELAARGKSPAAFNQRCIPLRFVVHRSNTAGIFPLLALLSARIADLGATQGSTTGC